MTESARLIDVSHIDTCLGCYLTDHHNRDGELLIGVPIDGSTTNQDVMQMVLDEFQSADWPADAEYVTDEAVSAAVQAYFAGCSMEKPFDSSLEINESDRDWEEPVQAWFLLTYADTEDADDDADDDAEDDDAENSPSLASTGGLNFDMLARIGAEWRN